jgi:hypothetical protein
MGRVSTKGAVFMIACGYVLEAFAVVAATVAAHFGYVTIEIPGIALGVFALSALVLPPVVVVALAFSSYKPGGPLD